MRATLLSFFCCLLAGPLWAQITADFSASPTSGCAPLNVQFSNASSGATSYSWDFGDGSGGSTLANPSHTYAPGSYTVTLNVSGPSGTATKTITSYINAYDVPQGSFSNTSARVGCAPLNVSFGSSVTVFAPGTASYQWDFGDGYSGTGASTTHSYTTPGVYNVRLIVEDAAKCKNSFVQNNYVTVYQPPTADFTASQYIVCNPPQLVSFTDKSTGFGSLTWNWNLGNGNFSSLSNPSTTYSTTGNYYVSLTVTDAHNCTSTKVLGVFVNGDPAQFSMPSIVCSGDSVLLTNTTPGNNGSQWNFGDGDSATGNPVKHRFPPSGSYTVKLTTTVGTCQKVAQQSITIAPKPAATINISPAIPCPLPQTLTFTANSPNATKWYWYFPDGTIDSGQSISKSYSTRPFIKWAIDSVKLITVSAVGCRDTVRRDTFKIRDLVVEIQPAMRTIAGCKPLTINFSTLLYTKHFPLDPNIKLDPYPFPGNGWTWDFGDGGTGNGAAVAHTYMAAGNYRVRCIVNTTNGCMDTGYADVHVDTPVHPSFTGGPVSVCPNTYVTYRNTTAQHLPGTTYEWRSTDTAIYISSLDSVRIRHKYPGTYYVMLISDHFGCRDTVRIDNYVTVHPPSAQFNDSIQCPPSTTVRFNNVSFGTTSYLWMFGDGDTSTLWNPVHTYTVPGVYTARLATYNSTYGCRDTSSSLLFLMKPTLSFLVVDSTICAKDTAVIVPQFSGNIKNDVYYQWLTDGQLSSFRTKDTFWHAYNTRGMYDVTLITKSGYGCLDTLYRPGAVAVGQPSANFGAYPPIGCQPLNVLFRDSTLDITAAKPFNIFWQFGKDTMSSTSASVNHVFATKGKYNVNMFVTDAFGCRDSIKRTDYIIVNAPKADFRSADTSICANSSAAFINTSTGNSALQYSWSFGDGGTAVVKNPSHQYRSRGQYSVRLVVTDSTGCTDTMLRTAYVRVKAPIVAFTVSDTQVVCPPLLDTFTNLSFGASKYVWSFGDGGSSTATNPTRIYIDSGVYTVTLTGEDDDGCQATAQRTLRVLGYDGAFTFTPPTGCVPLRVNFLSSVRNVAEIRWDFGDGGSDTGVSTSYTYNTTGSYLPRVIYKDSKGCSRQSKALDSVRVDRLIAGFRHSVPCADAAFTVTDSSYTLRSPAVNWQWIFGSNGSGSGKSVAYTADQSGLLPVTLIVTNAIGCRDTLTKQVFVNPHPPITAPRDTTLCPADTLLLTAAGAIHYQWTTNAGQYLSCDTCTTTLFHTRGVSKSVIYLAGVDGNGCTGLDSMNVVIQLKTSASIGAGGDICFGEQFTLHAEGADTYEWQPARFLDSPLIANPTAKPITTTTFTLIAREGTCLVDTQQVTITVHGTPHFDAGPDEWINLGGAVVLQPTKAGIERILWRSDTSLTCLECFNPAAHPYFTRTYWATAWDAYGCSTTDSVTVFVRCNGGLTFIPNTFSPNGDGQNDYFYPRGAGISRMTSFRIFNRWGEMVFERRGIPLNDEQSGWDGSYKGKALAPDTYYYVMESRCDTGEPVIWKGDITLMR